jgi:hypothetical protein
MSRVWLAPAPRIRIWPAQAVMPVFSRAALATKSEATKMVAGSPKPARLWLSVRTPAAQSAIADPTQTAMTGRRSQTKSTITAATTANTVQMSLMGDLRMQSGFRRSAGAYRYTISLSAQRRRCIVKVFRR